MLFAISTTQQSLVALAMIAGAVVCELTGHHDMALSMFGSGVTLVTLAQRPEPPKEKDEEK